MANHLFQNVIVIDSAMGNAELISASTGNLKRYHVGAIGFYAIDTTSLMTLTGANTAQDEVFKFGFVTQGIGASISPSFQIVNFANPLILDTLKIPVLTAATGWVYLA